MLLVCYIVCSVVNKYQTHKAKAKYISRKAKYLSAKAKHQIIKHKHKHLYSKPSCAADDKDFASELIFLKVSDLLIRRLDLFHRVMINR